MFRRVSLSVTAAAAAGASHHPQTSTATAALRSAARSIVVFSQQHHILEGNQKSSGSPSNVWIEEWEIGKLDLKPEAGAVPTAVRVDKQLELFNFDQLVTAPEVMEAPKHSSYSTRKTYSDNLQFELNDRAQKHGFQSRWWITRSSCYKDNLQLKPNSRPNVMLIRSLVKLFHSSQLVGGEVLDTYPVSGGSRRLYSQKGDVFNVLKEHIRANNFNSGLYFTRKQLEFFKLAPAARAQPVLQDMHTGERFMLYNVEQLEDPQLATSTLARAAVTVPTFLVSGDPIGADAGKKFLSGKKFKSNYWLTGREAELYQWAIREDQRREGVIFTAAGSSGMQLELFNVEQLTNPEEAFTKAGQYVQ